MSFEYVEFPLIGLRIPVVRTLFKVFGQDIYTYAIIIALSIVLMIFLGLRHCDKYKIRQDTIIDLMIFAMPASIICARIYYVVFSWDSYKDNLIDIFNIRQGGIAIYGAVIGAFLTVFIFAKIKKIDAIRFLDFGVPYLILAQGIGRWGNFVNQEVFGTNTKLPWGMTSVHISSYLASHEQWLATLGVSIDPYAPVHPTFLYESLWCVVVAFFLFWLRRRMKYKGEVLLGYLAGYGIGRAFIEGIRTDSLMLGGVRISQLISVLAVAACLIIIIFFRKKLPLYADDAPDEAVEAEAKEDGPDGEGEGAEAAEAADGEGEGEGAEEAEAADGAGESEGAEEAEAAHGEGEGEDSEAAETTDGADEGDGAEEAEAEGGTGADAGADAESAVDGADESE